MDYSQPTPIQMQAIPILLAGRELMGIAPTGSGKTAAYIIPILAQLKAPSKVGFRAVIITPTRELSHQIYREFKKLAKGKLFKICVLSKANSNAINNVKTKDAQRFDILITTPMRLVHQIRNRAIELNNVQHLVLDEADRLLDEGFLEQVDEVIHACSTNSNSKHLQRSLWSATMLQPVEDLARTFLRDPIHVIVGHRGAATSTIDQKLVYVGNEEGKLMSLRQTIREGVRPPVLIFVQSKDRAKELFQELIYDGVNVDVITAERTLAQRENIIKKFRLGKIWVLISTDLMGRGMDFQGITTVINFDLPQSAEEYIHRIGRTGRAGRQGESITFYTQEDVDALKTIANVMKNSGCDVPSWVLSLDNVSKKKKKFLKKRPIERKTIKTVSHYDIKEARKKRKQKKKELIRKHRKEKRMLSKQKKREAKVATTK